MPASSKNALKNALWAKTDFRALLNASRRDGRVVINPHFWLKQCRMVSANTGVAVTWVLRLSIGRLLSGKEADSPNSSDGIPSDRDELAPDYNVVTDAALRPKPKTYVRIRITAANTRTQHRSGGFVPRSHSRTAHGRGHSAAPERRAAKRHRGGPQLDGAGERGAGGRVR